MGHLLVNVEEIESRSGIRCVDGEEMPVRAGTRIRFDPDSARFSGAGAGGTRLLATASRRRSSEPRSPL